MSIVLLTSASNLMLRGLGKYPNTRNNVFGEHPGGVTFKLKMTTINMVALVSGKCDLFVGRFYVL